MRLHVAATLLALAACSPAQAPKTAAPPEAQAPSVEGLPAGSYLVDPAHGSLVFRADHLGFSRFTGRFARWNAALELDPANPESAQLDVTVDARSIESDNPPEGFLDVLRGADWLDATRYPEMRFRSTAIELTGPNTARVHGDLTLRGVTRPATLNATFNGGYAGHPLDPHARIGFSAHGVVKRSEYGVSIGVPPPGSTMGVGDDVEVVIEAEFTGPPWTPPAPAQGDAGAGQD